MGVVENEALEVFKRVAALPKINIHSVSTHMPVSNEDAKFTRGQLVRFRRIIERFALKFREVTRRTSCKAQAHSRSIRQTFDIVRAGIMLYGISPLPGISETAQASNDVEDAQLS